MSTQDARTDPSAKEFDDAAEVRFEAAWSQARETVELKRAIALEVRAYLVNIEVQLSSLRRRAKAAEESLRVSQQAARRSGLITRRMSVASFSRFQGQIDAARVGARSLIADAQPLCDEYDSACDDLRHARAVEREALDALITARRARDTDVERARRTRDLEEQARMLDALRLQEQCSQEREAASPRDEHYDPRYDEWEILLRRNRPWV